MTISAEIREAPGTKLLCPLSGVASRSPLDDLWQVEPDSPLHRDGARDRRVRHRSRHADAFRRCVYETATSSCSALRVPRSSYRVMATPASGRPSTAMYPMGTFTQDYEYVAGLGDLDECNGRFGVTPEHPEGIYHYYITDTFPFIQRCVKGTAMGGMMGPPPGDGGVGGDAGVPADGAMTGPRACTSTTQCTGACPAGSRGCTCASTPMGMACVPTCTTAADCPSGPMGMTLSCRSGVCAP